MTETARVDDCRRCQRARQTREPEKPEPGEQHAGRRAETVRAKYKHRQRARTVARDARRNTPALISGNVMPSRIDCGKMRKTRNPPFHDRLHRAEAPRRETRWRTRSRVVATKTSWNTRPRTPVASSTIAYQ